MLAFIGGGLIAAVMFYVGFYFIYFAFHAIAIVLSMIFLAIYHTVNPVKEEPNDQKDRDLQVEPITETTAEEVEPAMKVNYTQRDQSPLIQEGRK